MDLWVVCGWNRCGEPSQALRASSPGGRAKGAVGIDGGSGKFRFVEQTEGMVAAKAPLCKGSSAEGGEGLLQDKVEIYMGTNANSSYFQSLCSLGHLPSPIEKGGCVVEGFNCYKFA